MRDIKFRAWNATSREMLTPYFFVNDENFITQYGVSKPNEVMQFTGLKDKNSVEIYEGDVLSHSKQGLCVVKYGNKHFDYAGFTLENTEGMINTLQNPHIYEVIGNIYENPELIK